MPSADPIVHDRRRRAHAHVRFGSDGRQERSWRRAALGLLVGAATIAGALAISTTNVTAPEPADLTSPLAGGTGATAAAVYSNSYRLTQVLLWPSTWTAGKVTAGTPCSTYGLPVGSRTTKVIVATASLRRCA